MESKYITLAFGDKSLYDVAQRLGVTVKSLIDLNPNLKPNDIFIGQQIRVK